mmetsp:Transcript_36687/g.87164  ORF Transcript_36687/g.87164 Transcript_36687/m.87164 type:complete len:224 (-) Transcript_36687:1859-2530(-)
MKCESKSSDTTCRWSCRMDGTVWNPRRNLRGTSASCCRAHSAPRRCMWSSSSMWRGRRSSTDSSSLLVEMNSAWRRAFGYLSWMSTHEPSASERPRRTRSSGYSVANLAGSLAISRSRWLHAPRKCMSLALAPFASAGRGAPLPPPSAAASLRDRFPPVGGRGRFERSIRTEKASDLCSEGGGSPAGSSPFAAALPRPSTAISSFGAPSDFCPEAPAFASEPS